VGRLFWRGAETSTRGRVRSPDQIRRLRLKERRPPARRPKTNGGL